MARGHDVVLDEVTEGDGLDKTACRELIEEWKKMFLPLKITAGCEAEEGSSNSEDSTDGGEMEANPLWQRYELDPTEFILFVLGKVTEGGVVVGDGKIMVRVVFRRLTIVTMQHLEYMYLCM